MSGRAIAIVAAAAAVGFGCSDRQVIVPTSDAGVRPRVLVPPPTTVRAVPPHNVHSQGVGPYHLRQKLTDVLGLLPRGPRVELFRIEKLASFSLVRDQDGVQIGVDRDTGVQFIVAVAPEIAKTEQGVGVGAKPAELDAALGARRQSLRAASDPRLREYERLDNARFFVVDERVDAIVVAPALAVAEGDTDATLSEGAPSATDDLCRLFGGFDDRDNIVAASKLPRATARVVAACFSKRAREALVFAGPRLAIVGGEPGKRRRIATTSLSGLVFAAPLDIDGDGRAEIAAIRRTENSGELTLRLSVLRIDGSRATEIHSSTIYTLKASVVDWAGSRLSNSDVVVELAADRGGVRARGFFVERRDGRIRLLIPLKSVRRDVRIERRPPDAPRDGAKKTAVTTKPGATKSGAASDVSKKPDGATKPRLR